MRLNIILAILAAILAVPTVMTISAERSSFTDFSDVPRLFEGFTPENVMVVEITKRKRDENGELVMGANDQPQVEGFRLQRTADGWAIGAGVPLAGVPVTSDARRGVEMQILDHLERIRRDEDALVEESADDEQLAEFELSDDTGTLIRCQDKNGVLVAELILGRSARDAKAGQQSLRGFFVRRKDDRGVVLYEQDAWYLPLDPKQWVERMVLPRDLAGRVVRARIKNSMGTAEFKKEGVQDTTWEATEAPAGVGPVRQAEVVDKVNRAARTSVTDFVSPLPRDPAGQAAALAQFGLAEPEIVADLEADDGTVYTIAIGNKLTDKAEYYATLTGSNFIITINSYIRDALEFDIQSLFDPKFEDGGDEKGDEKGGEDEGGKDEGGK